jgi:hypothetical protein
MGTAIERSNNQMKQLIAGTFILLVIVFAISIQVKVDAESDLTKIKNKETSMEDLSRKNGVTCNDDSDCVCVGNPDQIDDCGQSGQMWKCLKDHTCRLIFESAMSDWESLSIEYLQNDLYCEQDEDCAIREGVCGFQPMNIFFDNGKLLEMQAHVDCVNYILSSDLSNLKCDNNQCLAENVNLF